MKLLPVKHFHPTIQGWPTSPNRPSLSVRKVSCGGHLAPSCAECVSGDVKTEERWLIDRMAAG